MSWFHLTEGVSPRMRRLFSLRVRTPCYLLSTNPIYLHRFLLHPATKRKFHKFTWRRVKPWTYSSWTLIEAKNTNQRAIESTENYSFIVWLDYFFAPYNKVKWFQKIFGWNFTFKQSKYKRIEPLWIPKRGNLTQWV